MSSLLDRIRYVVTGRELRQAAPPPPFISMQAGLGMPHTFKPLSSLSAYADNPWLYGAVNAISEECARTDMMLRIKLPNGEFEKVEKHQALDVLDKPLPMKENEARSHMTGRELYYLLYTNMLLNGESFWLANGVNAGGNPTRLHTLMPGLMREILGEDNYVSHYIYRPGGNQISYSAAEIIHMKKTNPRNIYRGQSPMQSARYAVEEQIQSDILNLGRLQNNAIPAGLLSTEQNVPKDIKERLVEQWRATFGGRRSSHGHGFGGSFHSHGDLAAGGASGKVGFLPNGVKFSVVEQNNQEMQFIEMKKLSRDEVLANYRVPIELLGITDNQTRANAEASNFVFQRYTVLPMLELVSDFLTTDYLPLFSNTEEMEFFFDDPVPANIEDKRETSKALFSIGSVSANEVRKEFNLDPIDKPAADETFLPFNLVPISSAGGSSHEEDENSHKEEESSHKDDKKKTRKFDNLTALPDRISDIFDIEAEIKILSDASLPFMEQAFKQGVGLVSDISPDQVFTASDSQALKRLSEKFAARAAETTEKAIKKAIEESLTNREGVAGFASRLTANSPQLTRNRAITIARTELTGAINAGIEETFTKEGVQKKEWFTNLDGRERPSHANMHGTQIPKTDNFKFSDSEGPRPGAQSFSAANRINCRCRLVNGDTSRAAKERGFEQFLRIHGSLEGRYAIMLQKFLQEQLQRILDNFDLSSPS